MVNPVGEDYGFGETPDWMPDYAGEPGTVLNLYGEQVGELALVNRMLCLSRDATVGVMKVGLGNPGNTIPCYICFYYLDGLYKPVEINTLSDPENMDISWDGDIAVACDVDFHSNRPNGRITGYDRHGSLLFNTDIGGRIIARPVISPDNRFIAVSVNRSLQNPYRILLIDASDGSILKEITGFFVRQFCFSPDGVYLACSGVSVDGSVHAMGINLDSDDDQGFLDLEIIQEGERHQGSISSISLCSNPELIGLDSKRSLHDPMVLPFQYNAEMLFNNQSIFLELGSTVIPSGSASSEYDVFSRSIDLSPNGLFAVLFSSDRSGRQSKPGLFSSLSIEIGR